MFAALKNEREGEGWEKEERDRLEAGKKHLSIRFELLVGLALNRLLTVKTTAMKVQFANGAKNKFAAFPSSNSKEPNTDKLRDKLGEISGMELSSF